MRTRTNPDRSGNHFRYGPIELVAVVTVIHSNVTIVVAFTVQVITITITGTTSSPRADNSDNGF